VDSGGIGYVKHLGKKSLGITREQIGNLARIADRPDDAVSALKKLIGELTAEAAADACNEPCAL
jgi:hypothetical protein